MMNDSLKYCDDIYCKHVKKKDNINNGMITKIWGPGLWESLHCITFGYPMQPTDEQKVIYKRWLTDLGSILPCSYCRESYQDFIKTDDTILSDDVMKDRPSLTYWLFKLHERVNKKLGVSYETTYGEIVKKYECYRAECKPLGKDSVVIKGCVVPLDYKRFSFKNYYVKDAPVISVNLSEAFYLYATLLNIDEKYFKFHKVLKPKMDDLENLKETKLWFVRNKACLEIIKNMRMNGESSINTCEPFINLPCKNEMKLILLYSSNLNITELNDLIKKIIENKDFINKIVNKKMN